MGRLRTLRVSLREATRCFVASSIFPIIIEIPKTPNFIMY